METSWESELAALLTDLSAVQDDVLDNLSRKRQLLVDADTDGLANISRQEEQLIDRLQGCLQRREQLLAQAAQEGLPSADLRTLSRALPRGERDKLGEQVRMASSRARLLRHQSLTNWVLAQRTLIHLSQMLEIIATGGRLQPTYGEGHMLCASGALVDRAA